MGGLVDWIVAGLIIANAAAITLWMAGAIYFDLCQEGRGSRLLVAGWVGVVLSLFIAWQPLWQPFAFLLGIAAVFLGWWLRQQPTHSREWDPAVAVLPHAVRAGEVVTIENLRNFDYPGPGAFTPRYETRTFDLMNLKSADIIFFSWGSSWMSHPVLVFDFGPDGRACGSIEVRYRQGQKYSILRSFYRQQELIFVVADERDIILRRTKYVHNQQAHLYHFTASIEELRAIFLDYVKAVNSLHDKPRWYHGLCANCTTSFYRLPSSRFRFDWRVLANGRLDSALYEAGRLDRSLPFRELRRIGYINDVANSVPEDGFGDHIRHELERRRHER